MKGAHGVDLKITQQVQQKIASRGVRSPCHVTVETSNGDVTLSGTVTHAHQKQAASQAASRIPGVRRVVDRMVVKATPKS